MGITTGLTGSIVQAFSWMLIHSLWQSLLYSLLAGIMLMLTRKTQASIRYNLVLILFILFLITAITTFFYEWNNIGIQAKQDQSALNLVNNKAGALPNSPFTSSANVYHTHHNFFFYESLKDLIKKFSDYFSAHSFLVAMLWLIFFIAKSISMTGHILYMRRARRCRVYAPTGDWKKKMESLCESLQLKKAVLLLESGYIKIPVVIGYFKPIILVPAGLITGIPAAQVEAILLHELAHIRRNDYLVNFLQNITEAVFFFNPGLLWLSSLIKEERENCCDDIAIAQTNNKEDFVQALISFKSYSLDLTIYTPAFSGQKSTLLNRVMRIVHQENKTLSVKESGIFIAGMTMLLLMAFTVYPVVKDVKLANAHSYISGAGNGKFEQLLKKSLNNVTTVLPEPGSNKLAATSAPAVNIQHTVSLVKAPVVDNNTDKWAMPASSNVDNSKFYSRSVLDSGYYDKIKIRLTGSRGVTTTLRHNAKVAFIINGVIHEESEAANFTQQQIDALSHGAISIGAIVNARNAYPDLDLSKYEVYVAIRNKLNDSAINPIASISPDD